MTKLSFAFWTLKYNYLTCQELKYAPSHCLCSWSLVDEHEKEKYLVVIDYYTPKSKPHGWWCALRGPGYQKGKHPQHLIFIKEGLETPSISQVLSAQTTIDNLIKIGLIK